jgi:hypothetical protein
MQTLKVFLLLYVITFIGMYVVTGKGASPIILPGDLYIKKAGKTIYVPMGSALILSGILLLIFKVVIPGF